jgi:Diadenosine tetraphosphate (Ap4A) hydrolase and other HIT family hydrolases
MPEPIKTLTNCHLCMGVDADPDMLRVQVWEDELWRLTTSIGPGDCTPGFSYLEPKRHIAHITDLDGPEAATFGPVMARCTRALKQATRCDLVYVYVFGGGIPHLHVHLAPHVEGDALNDDLLRGEFEARQLPSGATVMISKDFEALPDEELRSVAAEVASLLALKS